MKATIGLEYPGEAEERFVCASDRILRVAAALHGNGTLRSRQEDRGGTRRPWVAKITGRCPTYKFAREFCNANWDRSKCNSTGSRGLVLWFVLETGYPYEVMEYQSWRRYQRYYCAVDEDGSIVPLTLDSVNLWLDYME